MGAGRSLAAMVLAVAVAFAGCGGGGDDDNDNGDGERTTTSTDPTPTDPTPTAPPKPTFGFTLPTGEVDIPVVENLMYDLLQARKCKDADALLDDRWDELQTPRTVLIFEAGVHFCDGRNTQGARWLRDAEAKFGTSGLRFAQLECAVYREGKSVVEQRAPESFVCPEGPSPTWETDDPRDDPRTPDTDESTTTDTSESTDTSETTDTTADPSSSTSETTGP